MPTRPSSFVCAALLFTALLMFAPSKAAAQVAVDPTRLEFDASPDHDAVSDGIPVLSGYRLELYLPGAQAPFQTNPLGKPNADANGVIRLTLASIFGALPTPGITYTATVAAEGPGGIGRSGPTNQFTWSGPPPPPPPPPCSYSLSPAAQSVGSGGGSFSAVVTTGVGCSWTATENLSWVSITGGSSGTGTGSVTYSVTANAGASARNGSLTIAGRTLNVAQSGSSCTYTVSPTSATLPAATGTSTVTVTTASGCSWTATDNRSWITITSGASGSGNGTVTYSVTANSGTASRTGTLTIATGAVAVTQTAPSAVLSAPTNLRLVDP